ncbi:MAG: S-layer homology domain-containing protein, partial [Clostridium sp.]|nr:S-layer homology domain-containing protein [Clostridium sp.]
MQQRRFLTLWLGLSLLLALAISAPAWAFSDLGGTAPETQQAVDELAELGILNGYIDDTFRPDNSISRAEFAKVVAQAVSHKNGVVLGAVQELNFSDVSKNAWYAKDVANAVALGLMRGDAEGTFRPNDSVSKGEVITVLVRALGYGEADLRLADKQVIAWLAAETNRTEAELQAAAWPENYLLKALEVGLLNEAEADMLPSLLCSRG